MDKQRTLNSIITYFKTKDEVACAYLFGSFGTSEFKEGISDIDIAVIPKENSFFDTEEIKSDLEDLLQIEVDVCDMEYMKKMIQRDVYFRNECFYGQESEERMEVIDKFNWWAKENYNLLHLIEIERERYLTGYYNN